MLKIQKAKAIIQQEISQYKVMNLKLIVLN